MIYCIRDVNQDIVAVCEWLLFNEHAQIDDKGDILFIAECEINKSHRRNGVFKKILKGVYEQCPHVEKVFFFRKDKYPDRSHSIYFKNQFLRRIGG